MLHVLIFILSLRHSSFEKSNLKFKNMSTQTKQMMQAFHGLIGSQFVGIQNYTSKNGEVSNVTINANITYKNAQKKDLNTLKSLTEQDLKGLSLTTNLPFETMKIAHAEMINSLEKNLSDNKEEHTAASKAQADTYVHITPAIKVHKTTLEVYVTGLVENKTVLVPGEYKHTNKREKTQCKDAITKHCNLRGGKYREYLVGEISKIKISGQSITIN